MLWNTRCLWSPTNGSRRDGISRVNLGIAEPITSLYLIPAGPFQLAIKSENIFSQ